LTTCLPIRQVVVGAFRLEEGGLYQKKELVDAAGGLLAVLPCIFFRVQCCYSHSTCLSLVRLAMSCFLAAVAARALKCAAQATGGVLGLWAAASDCETDLLLCCGRRALSAVR
jgi:hypothetical protein